MGQNVYDFDKTIYAGDSTTQFFFYCALRHPVLLLELLFTWPRLAMMGLGLADKTAVKQRFYRFLTRLPDVDKLIADFWAKKACRIKPWYLAQKRADDVIISASPEFLLSPVVQGQLGLYLLASRVDPHTGKYTGKNCHGEEKVRRLREALPECRIDAFYSDSDSDLPLARLARQAYKVRGNRVTEWNVN